MRLMLFPIYFGLLGGLGATPVSDSPETVQEHYEQAASHLDVGGALYTIRNVDGHAEKNIEEIGSLIGSMSQQKTTGKTDLGERLKSYFREHGAFASHTLAASTVPRKNGLRDIKLFIGRDKSARRKLFWQGLIGGEPSPAKHLTNLPQNTVLALETATDADALWSMVRDGILRFACNGDKQKLAEMLTAAKQETGVSLDKLFASFKPNLTFSVQLDQEQTTTLPVPNSGRGINIPKPGFMIVAEVSNDVPLQFLRNTFRKEGNELESVDTDFGTMYRLPNPAKGPLSMQFTVMIHEKVLYVASEPALIKKQLMTGKAQNLGSNAEFKKAYKGLPEEGNVFFYCDAEFRTIMNKVIEQLKNVSLGAGDPSWRAMQMFIPEKTVEISSGWVLANRPEGLLLKGQGEGGFAQQLTKGSAGIYMPLMAAIAIPSFMQGREAAQRNACIHNLRIIDSAKQQWALETGAAGDAVPSGEEIGQYIDGGFKGLECPKGGNYSINKLDEKPECSMPGHSFPR